MPPDDEAIIAGCARRFWRGLSPGLTRDDLMQEGRIAIWLAERAGRVPADHEHRVRYIRARALGAMRDANRRAWRQLPMAVDELDEEKPQAAGDAQPDAILQLRQLIAHFARRGSARVKECVDLCASGCTGDEIATRMGISRSRVSQLQHEARTTAAAHW
jgi:RNA polymerase sigma factor (sigma-70 family)